MLSQYYRRLGSFHHGYSIDCLYQSVVSCLYQLLWKWCCRPCCSSFASSISARMFVFVHVHASLIDNNKHQLTTTWFYGVISLLDIPKHTINGFIFLFIFFFSSSLATQRILCTFFLRIDRTYIKPWNSRAIFISELFFSSTAAKYMTTTTTTTK
jgi:hypothetical protein